jgi:hypothetical protein
MREPAGARVVRLGRRQARHGWSDYAGGSSAERRAATLSHAVQVERETTYAVRAGAGSEPQVRSSGRAGRRVAAPAARVRDRPCRHAQADDPRPILPWARAVWARCVQPSQDVEGRARLLAHLWHPGALSLAARYLRSRYRQTVQKLSGRGYRPRTLDVPPLHFLHLLLIRQSLDPLAAERSPPLTATTPGAEAPEVAEDESALWPKVQLQRLSVCQHRLTSSDTARTT